MVVDTASAAGIRDGAVRYWMSVGPGGFSPSPKECPEACFYCIIFDPAPLGAEELNAMCTGIPEVTVLDTPMKPPLLATIKSNNYLLNVLTHMEAVDRGGTFGILVDDEGYVAEACVLNAAFVTDDGILRTPPFDGILSGTTIRRVMDLASGELTEEGLISSVSQAPLLASEVRGDLISEMFLCGGDTHLYPVTSWDAVTVGAGEVGPVARRLIELLEGEAFGSAAGKASDFIDVPYDD
jgi:4-amino-4-deoxychorismate lyase